MHLPMDLLFVFFFVDYISTFNLYLFSYLPIDIKSLNRFLKSQATREGKMKRFSSQVKVGKCFSNLSFLDQIKGIFL